MVISTLYELVVMPITAVDWKGLLPKDDQALKRELTRAFLSYLDVDPTPRTPTRTTSAGRGSRRQS